MSGSTLIYVLIAAVLLGALSWVVTPKGNQQTLIRTAALLTVTCCYLMWSITYMAQLHPLIAPRRSDIRLEHS